MQRFRVCRMSSRSEWLHTGRIMVRWDFRTKLTKFEFPWFHGSCVATRFREGGPTCCTGLINYRLHCIWETFPYVHQVRQSSDSYSNVSDYYLWHSALMDISKSISLYLHDEKSIYRVLGIDLCSRGFNVWQHYVNSMEILRSLFDLATNARKDSISIQNVGSQARLAVLSIASNNMPLFVGTLCLDILTPPTVEHRRSVMQILAFLIEKVFFFFSSSV